MIDAAAGKSHTEGNGVNLLPYLLQNKPMEPRGLYWEFGKSQAFQLDGWKLIQFKKEDGIDIHLYNLREDPGELNNVANEQPDLVSWLKELSINARTKSNAFPSFMDAMHTD